MTKKLLLARARELHIVGRDKMNVETLTAKIEEIENARTEVAAERRRKKVSHARRNRPWLFKLYRVNPERAAEALATKKMPKQVRSMIEAMLDAGFTDEEHAVIGEQIANAAKERGLNTPMKSAALAAYYIPLMCKDLGLEFVRYENRG